MSRTIKQTPQQLTCNSYPHGLLVLVATFWLLGAAGFVFTDTLLSMLDHFIFNGVIVAGIAILQQKVVIFNKADNTVSVRSKGVFNNRVTTYPLSDVTGVEMAYGRGGGNASGGSIIMNVNDKRVVIAGGDVFNSELLENKKNQQIIADFLR
jgi:hypothetical protein